MRQRHSRWRSSVLESAPFGPRALKLLFLPEVMPKGPNERYGWDQVSDDLGPLCGRSEDMQDGIRRGQGKAETQLKAR